MTPTSSQTLRRLDGNRTSYCRRRAPGGHRDAHLERIELPGLPERGGEASLHAQRRPADAGSLNRALELLDSSQPYLWVMARDSKGNLYAGGAGAKLYRIEPNAKTGAKPKPVAEFDALEIHGLAVDARDRVYVMGRLARRQVLSNHRKRQARGFLRPQDEVHLGDRVRQQRQSLRRHRRSRGDSRSDAGRQGQTLLFDRRDARAVDDDRP